MQPFDRGGGNARSLVAPPVLCPPACAAAATGNGEEKRAVSCTGGVSCGDSGGGGGGGGSGWGGGWTGGDGNRANVVQRSPNGGRCKISQSHGRK